MSDLAQQDQLIRLLRRPSAPSASQQYAAGPLNGWIGGITPQAWQQLMQAPVGTSRLYPDTLTNPDPSVSPVVPPALRDPMAVAGARMRGQGGPLTADMLAAGSADAEAVANQALGWAGQVINKVPPGIRAFHGSPHTFDRFAMDKIGTGEGAQAYGHGLYFAGNEGVARSYRDANQTFETLLNGRKIAPSNPKFGAVMSIAAKGYDDALKEARLALSSGLVDPSLAQRHLDDILSMKGAKIAQKPTGSMYEVNLRTSPDRLLDWDKPLSEQPRAVLDALGVKDPSKWKTPKQSAAFGGMNLRPEMTGADIARQPDAAHVLRNAGLDGIQYLDQGSRAAGEGTRNYVMFRDDIIDILRRYGLFGLIGGGAAAGVGEQSQ